MGTQGRLPVPIDPESIDFDRPGTLVHLAIVTRLDAFRGSDGVRRQDVAKALGMEPPQFSKRLAPDALAGSKADDFVQQLQIFLQVREERLGVAGSEIAAFRKHILRQSAADAIGLRVPTTFFKPLASQAPRSLEDILLVGTALVGIRSQARTTQMARQLRQISKDRLVTQTVRRLVLGCCLPHEKFRVTITITAQLRDWAVPEVARHLVGSPLASRSIRVLTRMLRDLPAGMREDAEDALWHSIAQVLQQRRCPDIDPGRGFYEESLRFSPGWKLHPSKRGWEEPWIPEQLALIARNQTGQTPLVRQRAFAALCLSERSQDERDQAKLIVEGFRQESSDDPSGGLLHAAEYLSAFIDQRDNAPTDQVRTRIVHPPAWKRTTAFVNLSPTIAALTDEAARREEHAVLAQLPPTVRQAILKIVLCSLFSLDITDRRIACDTLTAANAAGTASEVITRIITSKDCPEFLREVGAVVIGYLGHPRGLSVLAELASDTNRPIDTRRAAVLALGELRPDRRGPDRPLQIARPALLEALKEPALHDAALFAAACRDRQDREAREDREIDRELADAVQGVAAATDERIRLRDWAANQIRSESIIPLSPFPEDEQKDAAPPQANHP